MLVRGKQFIVKIPMIENNSIYLHALANAKIHYRLEHTNNPKNEVVKKYIKISVKEIMLIICVKNCDLSSQLLKFPILR